MEVLTRSRDLLDAVESLPEQTIDKQTMAKHYFTMSFVTELTSRALAHMATLGDDDEELTEEENDRGLHLLATLKAWSSLLRSMTESISRFNETTRDEDLQVALDWLDHGYRQALLARNPEMENYPPLPKTREELFSPPWHVITDADIAELRRH